MRLRREVGNGWEELDEAGRGLVRLFEVGMRFGEAG